MQQFIKISNDKLKRKTSMPKLADLGTFMLLQTFLSVPDFRTPNGGLINAALKHCKNKNYSFNNSWVRLKDNGFLKRTRMPIKSNKFYDHYRLLNNPNTEISSVTNLTAVNGKKFIASGTVNFENLDTDYTAVSRDMILDSALSLQAKGLYAVIQRMLLIAAHTDDVIVTKELIRKICKEGRCAFNHYWNELKKQGYLLVEKQYYDNTAKKTVFKYSLKNGETVKESVKEKRKIRDSETAPQKQLVLPDGYAAFTPDKLKSIINENIEIDTLLSWADDFTNALYDTNDIENTVDLMINSIINKQTIKVNGIKVAAEKLAERLLKINIYSMHKALNNLILKPPRFNPISYILTLLYNYSYNVGMEVD